VFPFTGSFVVDHYVLVLRVFPEVIDSAEDQEISRTVPSEGVWFPRPGEGRILF
jgi:hypothetical protein